MDYDPTANISVSPQAAGILRPAYFPLFGPQLVVVRRNDWRSAACACAVASRQLPIAASAVLRPNTPGDAIPVTLDAVACARSMRSVLGLELEEGRDALSAGI